MPNPSKADCILIDQLEIESSRANSTVVGNWASSIQQWMSPTHDDDQLDDIQASGGGDIIVRAKGVYSMMRNRQLEDDFSSDSLGTIFTALSFLSGTLEALDKDTLKSGQGIPVFAVHPLVSFPMLICLQSNASSAFLAPCSPTTTRLGLLQHPKLSVSYLQ